MAALVHEILKSLGLEAPPAPPPEPAEGDGSVPAAESV